MEDRPEPVGMYATCVNGCRSVISTTFPFPVAERIPALAPTADVPKAMMAKHVAMKCERIDWPRDNKRGVEAIGVGLQKEQKEMIGDGKEAYHGRTEYSRIRDLSRS